MPTALRPAAAIRNLPRSGEGAGMRRGVTAWLVLTLLGCSSPSAGPDALLRSGTTDDAGVTEVLDSGLTTGAPDAGAAADAGPAVDGGPSDAGAFDAGTAADAGAGELGGGDWPQYRHDPASCWSNPGDFTAGDVGKLAVGWTYSLGGYPVSQPAVADGTVFLTDGYSAQVAALDLQSGALKWSRTFDHVFTDACSNQSQHPGIWAAPAVLDGVVYVPSPDGNLYALSATDGSTLWSAHLASTGPVPELVESSPAVAMGQIFVGVASVFGCDPIEGRIASIDLASHAVSTRALTNPGQPGAPVWSSISVDEAAGRIYATTGDTAGATFAQEPLAQAIVAFDAHTLAVVDSWQDTLSADDSDFGASPTLFNSSDGTPLIAAPNKDGWLFVLRRDALSKGPVWKTQLAVGGDPVDPSDGKGSIVGPTFAHGLLIAGGGQTPAGESGSITAFDPGTGHIVWRDVPQGYVLAGMPAVGDVLVAGVNAPGNAGSLLELIDIGTGRVLRTFGAAAATFGSPAVAHGTIIWVTTDGTVTALRAP